MSIENNLFLILLTKHKFLSLLLTMLTLLYIISAELLKTKNNEPAKGKGEVQ